MSFAYTTATKKISALDKRIRAVTGGTSASKTISIMLWLIAYCQTKQKEEKLVTVTSESYPHLLGGAILDFQNIMQVNNYWKQDRWVRNPRTTYTFETGNKMEFVTFDSYGKAHGGRRDVLFINEGNYMAYNIVDQLMVRTRETIWLDWNPTSEFWFYNEMLGKRDDIDFITVTYKDNEALDANTIAEIESHKSNRAWWQVYGLGQLGQLENQIYTNWIPIDNIPKEARLVRYGLDFGYTNDPTASDAIYVWNGAFITDEVIHQKGLKNRQIADIFLNRDRALIIADGAEPKSIDELSQEYGLNVIGSKKGRDSVNQGIQYVQGQKIFITKRSLNTIKEQRNYLWMKDKDGVTINEPDVGWDHHMDDIRYALESLKATEPKPIQTDFGGVGSLLPGTLD
jgi:phage terminase large subunit